MKNKLLFLLFVFTFFCLKGFSCNCVDSVVFNEENLIVSLSNNKEIKLKYTSYQDTVSYKKNTFIFTNFDLIQHNTLADSLSMEIRAMERKYEYGEPMIIYAGYIIYDNNNVYFVNLSEYYSNKTNNAKLAKYKFSKLCLDEEHKTYYITFIANSLKN